MLNRASSPRNWVTPRVARLRLTKTETFGSEERFLQKLSRFAKGISSPNEIYNCVGIISDFTKSAVIGK